MFLFLTLSFWKVLILYSFGLSLKIGNDIRKSDFAFEGVVNLRFLENEKMSQ